MSASCHCWGITSSQYLNPNSFSFVNASNLLQVPTVRAIVCLCQAPHSGSLAQFSCSLPLCHTSALISTHIHNGRNPTVHTVWTDKSRRGGRFAGTRTPEHWGMCTRYTKYTRPVLVFQSFVCTCFVPVFNSFVFEYPAFILFTVRHKSVIPKKLKKTEPFF